MPARFRAFALHLGVSLVVAAFVASLVFLLWYPQPYREMAGGRELFLIVIAVDVVLGPLLTLAVFDTSKPRLELVRDLSVIALVQLAGLAYGLYTVERARPAVVALERDRLRLVRSIDLDGAALAAAPEGLRQRSWVGPLYVATRAVRQDEKMEAMDQALAGSDIGARPAFWLPPSQTTQAWAAGGRPMAQLRRQNARRGAVVDAAVAATGRHEGALKYLPVIARRTDFVVLIDGQSGEVVGSAPLDGHL